MTSATRAPTTRESVAEPGPRRAVDAVVGVFRDPLRTFVVLALVVGGYLVFTVPYFGGIDEPAHFYRTYQITTGQFVPEKVKGSDFSGACIPVGLVDDVAGYQRAYFKHLVSLDREAFARLGTAPVAPDSGATRPPQCTRDERFITFSTFGSPVPYVPQAAAILVARGAGLGAGGMLLAGRIVLLGAYVAVVAVAIRRAPRARWGLCATALIPV